ncbi:HepT-like ribonuclease domain-containing protein [Novosphingobium sp. B 225]|uniref:HepT-like ribonuclease domain-containing protein n=1 Tax=Novosphingobium sp. B 225 TaxID=1961849 RepID=UPI000B4ABD56|nr:HepT-like ribonuclease domain-containing protein [Novosphingobium sp. B 225]
MSSDDPRVGDWLRDIIDNAIAAENYVGSMNAEQFSADRMRIDAVERCLMRLTEAAIRLGEERLAQIVPDIPMHQIRGLGNMLRHAYDGIDPAVVWATVVEDLPKLRAACEKAVKG